MEKVYKSKSLDGEWGKVRSLEGAERSKPQQPGGTWSEVVRGWGTVCVLGKVGK